MATSIDQVAIGYDEAKIAVYQIMARYFPKIETSQSDLVNAFMSGMALMYAMFQTFARLLQNELYVSTATELESLYKLIPFVGITLSQPLTLKTESALAIQDAGMTTILDPVNFLTGTDPFIDTDGNKFYLRISSYISKKLYAFSADNRFRSLNAISPGRYLEISLSKNTDQDIPVSNYDTDSILFEIPYYEGYSATVKKIVLLFNKTTYPNITSAADSDNPAVVDLGSSHFYPETGQLTVVLNALLGSTFASTELYGLPINVTFTQRSAFRRAIPQTANIAYYAVGASSPYKPANIFTNASAYTDPSSVVNFSHSTAVRVVAGVLRDGIDIATLKLTSTLNSNVVFDFSEAEELNDMFWGTVYKTTVVLNSVTYSAYVLDKWIGLVAFEDAVACDASIPSPGNSYTVEFDGIYNSKAWLEQYEKKNKVVAPPTEFDFTTMTYVLEDTDYILFENLVIKINDAGTVFEQVDNLVTVQGSTGKTYFSVVVLSPTKIKIKFENVLDWANVQNLSIDYNTVKQINSYAAGIVASGPSSMEDKDKVPHVVSGVTSFNFDATNNDGQVGVAGIPTLESLRSTLEKAAYTLDNIVNQLNYEAAIQTYFISQGWDARVKVFKYEDFGTLFINWTNGNFVFFVGLINKFPNSNFVLTVPSDIGAGPVGGAVHVGQYTRAQLATQLPGSLTDTTLSFVMPITAVDANNLNTALRAKMVLTNYLLSTADFILLYAVYFKVKIKPKNQYTFSQASNAVKQALESLFNWEDTQLARDINVSDVYSLCDGLPEVDKVLFLNFSHHKNSDTANLRVRDVTYKTITQVVSTTMKLGAFTTGNKFQVRTRLSTVGNKFSATAAGGGGVPANSITVPGAGTFNGFFVALDTVNITGFATAGNNGSVIRVVSVGNAAGVDYIELNSSDITLVNEASVVDVQIQDATDLESLGMTVGRRITISNFLNAANNVSAAEITAASASEIIIDTADSILVNETYTLVIISSLGERMENPLWDFSTAIVDREVRIDILALGGIETEQY